MTSCVPAIGDVQKASDQRDPTANTAAVDTATRTHTHTHTHAHTHTRTHAHTHTHTHTDLDTTPAPVRGEQSDIDGVLYARFCTNFVYKLLF